VDQGAGLVRAMLGYSRGNAAPRKVLDAREAVARALRLFDEHLQARIRFQAPSGPGYRVHAPPEMLQQIVLNLVQNADESMDRKGVIGVEIREGPAPKECAIKPAQAARYVIITVRDSGAGIPPENLGRIFEPFFTTKGFSSRRGTGLGLSMVYEFAKELGAGIAVDSRVGEGATFEVIIPAHQKDPDPEPTAA
jgi:two-component system cell cycle sensor histidine kinase/response regulator CckA